jgi:hypothetical protein
MELVDKMVEKLGEIRQLKTDNEEVTSLLSDLNTEVGTLEHKIAMMEKD